MGFPAELSSRFPRPTILGRRHSCELLKGTGNVNLIPKNWLLQFNSHPTTYPRSLMIPIEWEYLHIRHQLPYKWAVSVFVYSGRQHSCSMCIPLSYNFTKPEVLTFIIHNIGTGPCSPAKQILHVSAVLTAYLSDRVASFLKADTSGIPPKQLRGFARWQGAVLCRMQQ